jgi:hypothetical protein
MSRGRGLLALCLLWVAVLAATLAWIAVPVGRHPSSAVAVIFVVVTLVLLVGWVAALVRTASFAKSRRGGSAGPGVP